jgi:NAD+ synthase/NAD+ synthase (glutamine-hydrolysing)
MPGGCWLTAESGQMKIALAQLNPTVGDFSGNAARILSLAAEARARGAQLSVFSELCLCGYLPHDLVERPAFFRRTREELARLAREISLPSIVGTLGYPQDETGKGVSNCAAVIAEGKILFEQRKMLLPTYDVFDESRYFQPAKSLSVFPFCGSRLGIVICEDMWNDKLFWEKRLYERDPVSELAEQGSGVLINLSASPYTLGKRAFRIEMLSALARRHRQPVIYVNQVGGNDSLVFDGASLAITAEGKVAAQAHSFEEDLVLFDTATGAGEIRPQPETELDAVYRALACGTRDYVRKCGFQRVIIGLSGGIDSAVVACIATAALGAANVTGVAMPGPFSSEGSLRDARALAQNLGISFQVVPISEVHEKYLATLAPVLEGRQPDVTEENIQARIRGNILMALSNNFGALVLSTGNKSELAVGYCTLYGDMAGGLAVISDVPKTMVYDLARLINRSRELIPAASLTKPPSAELRPNQTDQDTLPPYEVLDRILKAYVEDLRGPEEIAKEHGIPMELVREVALRVDRNEYKRQQAAPGLKVTSKAFGIGRRFPIAQKHLV